MSIVINRLDHLVMSVASIEESCTFYTTVLGMKRVAFGHGRTGLAFGSQRINLHERGREFDPRAAQAVPGSANLCFITETPITVVVSWLAKWGVVVEEGPVYRTGAQGTLLSVYFRDPDNNLIELSNEV